MEIRIHLLKVNEGRNFCSEYRTSLFLFVQQLSEPYTLHVNGWSRKLMAKLVYIMLLFKH